MLKEILREEWGFDGLVVTDWGASNDHVKGVACRSNLEMPAPGLDAAREVLAALEEGSLSMEELDQCTDDLLDAVLTLAKNREKRVREFDREAHQYACEKSCKREYCDAQE